jgi:HEAT repeat protein
MASPRAHERREAVVRLPWFTDPEATDKVIEALRDRNFVVRKAAVKALVGVDDPRCEEALRKALEEESNPKLATWIQRVLKFISDINLLREAQSQSWG